VPAPTDRWFQGAGIRVHGLDWGGPPDGPVILLLHGVGGNAWVWADVADRLRIALPGHRVIAIDQRDGGDTDHPARGYERETFASDVAAVHDALGGGPLVLVGHSRGGWLASWIAASEPERIDRLVLVDPARLGFGSPADEDRFFAWVEGGLGPFTDEAAALAWAKAKDAEAVWSPTRERSFLFGFVRSQDGRLVGKLPREALAGLRAARQDGPGAAAALERIHVPTLLLIATRQTSERQSDKRRYGELIAGARVQDVDGTHFLHTDAPDVVAEAIAAFVSGPDEPT